MGACECEKADVGELGVDGRESDESVEGDESDGSSEVVSTVRFSLERALRRVFPGKARLTKLVSLVVRLESRRRAAAPLSDIMQNQRIEYDEHISNTPTVELLVALPRLSKTYDGGMCSSALSP